MANVVHNKYFSTHNWDDGKSDKKKTEKEINKVLAAPSQWEKETIRFFCNNFPLDLEKKISVITFTQPDSLSNAAQSSQSRESFDKSSPTRTFQKK